VGLFNAAVWFGATILLMVSVVPGTSSQDMKDLLGEKNFPYFSVAIAQVLLVRYYHVFLACSIISFLHVAAEWLYLGKYPQRFWLMVLVVVWVGGVAQACWIQPKLKQLHRLQFTRAEPRDREAMARGYRLWQGISKSSNVLLLAGLSVYFWRLANPLNRRGS